MRGTGGVNNIKWEIPSVLQLEYSNVATKEKERNTKDKKKWWASL